MTYHPILKWSCQHCQQVGEVLCEVVDSADIRWQKVLDDHLDQSESCYGLHGASGIAVKEESLQLPA